MSTISRLVQPDTTRGRLAAEIRSRMARYGLSQTELAVALGMSQSQVSKRLRALIPIDIDELDVIAAFLETTPVDLLGGQEKPPSGGPDGGLEVMRARRYSKPQPSDPKVGGSPHHVRVAA